MGKSFSCGLAAGIIASVVTHPADVIKTSMQLFPSRYQHRTREAILSIYRRLGVRGFFSGLVPRLVRRTLVSALSWTVYDRVRKRNALAVLAALDRGRWPTLLFLFVVCSRSCNRFRWPRKKKKSFLSLFSQLDNQHCFTTRKRDCIKNILRFPPCLFFQINSTPFMKMAVYTVFFIFFF